MKSGQFHDCVTVLNFESTHGMLRIALIGEKVHQVEEQDYRLVCGTERLEVSYKEIMYIQQNEGTDVHECHCFDLTAEPGTSVIHPAKLVENLARVAYASDGIFLQ